MINLDVKKNSMTEMKIMASNPVKTASVFQEPTRFAVLPSKIPKDNMFGKNRWAIWKTIAKVAEIISPKKTALVFLEFLKIREDIINRMKEAKTNQNVPTSSIIPNIDIFGEEESREDANETRIIAIPERNNFDLGKTILPSKNRATVQDMTETANPTTTISHFDVSIGILVNGKKKTGNNTTTTNNDQNEILSKVFDNIFFNLN